MSLDNQATLNIPSMQDEKPKSGGALKWILGGCGCLVLLAVICGGGLTVYFGPYVRDVVGLAQELDDLASRSEVVQENLGSPVEVKAPPRQVFEGDAGSEVVFAVDVEGPKGSGRVVSKATIENWRLGPSQTYLEFNGEQIDLNIDDELDIEVEGLDE